MALAPLSGLPGLGGGLLPGGGTTGTGGTFPGPGTISIGFPGTSGSSGSSGGGGGGVNATEAAYATSAAGWLLGLDWGRIAAFLLGLIFIIGGIFLIKEVRQTVVVAGKHVGKAVATAGEAAA